MYCFLLWCQLIIMDEIEFIISSANNIVTNWVQLQIYERELLFHCNFYIDFQFVLMPYSSRFRTVDCLMYSNLKP